MPAQRVERMDPITVAYHDVPGPSLDEAQRFVQGFVELLWLDDGRQLLVNEDGLDLQLPVNTVASRLYGLPLVGNCLLLSGTARWIE